MSISNELETDAKSSNIDWSVFEDDRDSFSWLLGTAQLSQSHSRIQKASEAATDDHFCETDSEVQEGQARSSAHESLVSYNIGRTDKRDSSRASKVRSKVCSYNLDRRDNAQINGCSQYQNDNKEDVSKILARREKNLASVRKFRKRKIIQIKEMEKRLKMMEAENLELRMRLKIGKEAIRKEQEETRAVKEQMQEMLKRNASERDIAQVLKMYRKNYTDFGPDRRAQLKFHISMIKELLLPTEVTKLCLSCVEQGKEICIADVARNNPLSNRLTDSHKVCVQEEYCEHIGDNSRTLWCILAKELNISHTQEIKILDRRAAIGDIRNDLDHTLKILEQLEQVTEEKNTALETQIKQIQQVLTPSQITKFIIWVKENPAFMYMLDRLVDLTLEPSNSHKLCDSNYNTSM